MMELGSRALWRSHPGATPLLVQIRGRSTLIREGQEYDVLPVGAPPTGAIVNCVPARELEPVP